MFKKIKQALCNHTYVSYLSCDPHYNTCGDEAQNRKSKKYYLHCFKCDKKIYVVDNWKNCDIEEEMNSK